MQLSRKTQTTTPYKKVAIDKAEQLNSIGISLSSEKDGKRLLEKIIIGAQSITHSDGGTLYLMDGEKHLRFEIMRTTSLGIAYGGTTGKPVPLQPIEIEDEKGNKNLKTIAAYSVITGHTVNILDAYKEEGFDFSGTKAYDKKTGYRSKSFLTIPMKNHENEIIGVLQLINALDEETSRLTTFSYADQRLAESLASQAAVALTNQSLIEELRNLLERFIEVIATAIDAKSPYTGGHCRRVPEIATAIAHAINNTNTGVLADKTLSDIELYELKIASLLHDCGKITTPVHVVDKATKLETIFDRIELIKARFDIMKKNAKIHLLETKLASSSTSATATNHKLTNTDQEYETLINKLDSDLEFLSKANIGSEFMTEEDKQRVLNIGKFTHKNLLKHSDKLLTENEIYNLCVPRGTLTFEERKIINDHIVMTQKMLHSLPFPKHLKNVPEIAGGHHERMDGKGYPNGLTGDQMSIQTRLMCIADIFEALTAADRPYKKAMSLSVALTILGKMKLDKHIDPDLFDIFVREKVYLSYAKKFLHADQIDDIDLNNIPGYSP